SAARGEHLFRRIGCAGCHVSDWVTAPKATRIGDFLVPNALANKRIHPFSDFMLHDIGTGDGIVQTQFAQRAPQGMTRYRLNTLCGGTLWVYEDFKEDPVTHRLIKGR